LNHFQVITQKPNVKDDVTIRVSDTVPNLGPVDEHKTEFNQNGDINIFVHEKRLGDRDYSGDPLHDLGWRTEIKVNSICKRQVPNLRLETAEKLISYFNGLVDDTL